MRYARCFIPAAHRPHDWHKDGAVVTCAGHALRRNTPAHPIAEPTPTPLTLPELLCHPDITVRPDHHEIAVTVLLPSHLASRLAALLPDPERRDALTSAAHEIAREEDCAVMDRRDLTRTEPHL